MTVNEISPKGQSNSRTKIIAGAVILAAVLIVAHFVMGRGGGPEEAKPRPVVVETAVARIASVDTVVSAQGTLVPSQGFCARVGAPSGGRLQSVRVREGDRVKAGQVLALVDSRVQSAQADSAASALRVAELQAKQAKLGAKAAAIDQSHTVELARVELDMAQTELAMLKHGARPQELAQAQQAVKQAQATRDRAASEVERQQVLFDKGISAKRELEDAKTALAVADSTLESAKQQAELVKAGARPEELRAAELKVKSARTALAQAEHGALQVAAKEQEAQAADVSISEKRADLAAAQATAGYTTLRSPIAGVVTRRLFNPGDVADPTSPVIEVCDSHVLDLQANIPAEDGMTIRPDMKVKVAAAAAPGETFTGKVVSVGEVDPQSGLLSIRITVNNPRGVLKVGAYAVADVVLRTNPRAIVVPKAAVLTREDKSVAFVVTDDKAHQREVKPGVEQGNDVQILSGVRAGDRVITLGQYELTDGAEVRSKAEPR